MGSSHQKLQTPFPVNCRGRQIVFRRASHYLSSNRGVPQLKASHASPWRRGWLGSVDSGPFLTGAPLEALPDYSSSPLPIPLLRRWHLCQALVQHLWKRWSSEYPVHLQRFTKWKGPSRNLREGDIVCVRDENLSPARWPLARIKKAEPGKDGKVRVVTIVDAWNAPNCTL